MASTVRTRSWLAAALLSGGAACGAFGTDADGADAGSIADAMPADGRVEPTTDAHEADAAPTPPDDDADHGCRLTLPLDLPFADFYDPTVIGWTRDQGMVPAVEGLTAPPTTGIAERANCHDATPNDALSHGVRLVWQAHVTGDTKDQLTLLTVGDGDTTIDIRLGQANGFRVAQNTDSMLGTQFGKPTDGDFVVLSLLRDGDGTVHWCGDVTSTRDDANAACPATMLDGRPTLVLPVGLQTVRFGLPEQSNGLGITTIALTITDLAP